jgi:hypothetical protein
LRYLVGDSLRDGGSASLCALSEAKLAVENICGPSFVMAPSASLRRTALLTITSVDCVFPRSE